MFTALVKIDVAAVALQRPPKEIFDLVEGGSSGEPGLLWIWNLAHDPAGRRRELRFWLAELNAHARRQAGPLRRQSIGETIAAILPGNRVTFNAGDVDALLQIRPRTRLDYGPAELQCRREQGRNVYGRAGLENFLCRRWLGAKEGKNHV